MHSGSGRTAPGGSLIGPNGTFGFVSDSEREVPVTYSKSDMKKGIMTLWNRLNFYIAIKELIIEWQDYQTEVCGYIYCRGCEDQIAKSEWLDHLNRIRDTNENDAKKLLCFVKSPGLKTTVMKIQNDDLEFFPVRITRCELEREISNELVKPPVLVGLKRYSEIL